MAQKSQSETVEVSRESAVEMFEFVSMNHDFLPPELADAVDEFQEVLTEDADGESCELNPNYGTFGGK